MAPRIQPKTLYTLSTERTSRIIDQACTNVFLEHGCFGNFDSLHAIEEIQKFLVDLLPLTVFEHLSDDRNSQTQSHLWSKDARIKLAVFMHPNLTKFSVDGRTNELMEGHDDGGLDELFWCGQLKSMNNLTHLNLNLITTDEILLIVGAACPKLEVVNIFSRIKQDVCHDRNLHPGVSLKYCVSDIGLKYLQKCKKLRRITMNKVINSHNSAISFHGISLSGVASLIFSLPDLEYINFGSIGKILQSDWGNPVDLYPLKLTYFSELDPNFTNVNTIQKYCPRIQHISLAVPHQINTQGLSNVNVSKCNNILRTLSSSELHLRVIELQYYPFGEEFRELLRRKGSGIEEILFRANGKIGGEQIKFIGETCPNLQKLHLKDVNFEERPMRFTSEVLKMNLFKELVCVYICGRMWNPSTILPLLLSNAHKIKQISLLNMFYELPMDGAMLKLFQYNNLNELSNFTLYSGCFLSMNLIRRLVFDCPNLTGFSFLQSEGLDISDIDALKQKVESLNLNVTLKCFELEDR